MDQQNLGPFPRWVSERVCLVLASRFATLIFAVTLKAGLALATNQLTGTIPTEIITNNLKLNGLWLGENQLTVSDETKNFSCLVHVLLLNESANVLTIDALSCNRSGYHSFGNWSIGTPLWVAIAETKMLTLSWSKHVCFLWTVGTLDLYNNSFTGEIPDLSNLPALRICSLGKGYRWDTFWLHSIDHACI